MTEKKFKLEDVCPHKMPRYACPECSGVAIAPPQAEEPVGSADIGVEEEEISAT